MKHLLAFIGSLLFSWANATPAIQNTAISPTPQARSIGGYAYEFFTINDGEEAALYGNWKEKKPLKEMAEKYNCQSAINAGFYDIDSMPLGLFVNHELQKDKPRNSNLTNGYVYRKNKRINISYTLEKDVEWAIQTGPILIKGMKTINDKPARRSVAIRTGDKAIFATIYSRDSRLDGPTLEELPAVVDDIANKEQWKISTAINLDGGSASAFYAHDIYIPELTMIGSFFCKKSLR